MKKQFIAMTETPCTFENHIPAPLFRKSFFLDFAPEKASLSIAGLGFYILTVNGKDITKGALAPYISNLDHYIYYDTYDLTPYLAEGENVIGVMLGNGFMNPFGGAVWDFQLVPWLASPRVAFEFSAECGEDKIDFSADESVRTYTSPITFDEYRMGEHYDARLEVKGWNEKGFDDSDWQNAIPVSAPRGALCEATAEPIKVYKEIKPVSIEKTENGDFLYDFGINAAGLLSLSVNATAGQKIVIQHCERLIDGKFNQGNLIFGSRRFPYYQQGYTQSVTYTAKGEGREEYTPYFCYFGFRYALVTGITDEQATKDLLTYKLMSSDIGSACGFSSSDETLNKIFAVTQSTNLSNFYYFPTDCPHREKNGWTGDAANSAEQMTLLHNTEKSFTEWLRNMRALQREDGMLPGIVPTGTWGYHWGNGPAWDKAAFEIPYVLWRYRGNTDVIRENATMMMRYLFFAERRRKENGLIEWGLGDWCPPGTDAGKYTVPLTVTDSIMVLEMAKKASEMFRAVGYAREAAYAKALHDDLRLAIRREMIDFDRMEILGDKTSPWHPQVRSQSGQALAIFHGIFDPEEEKMAVSRLIEMIHEANDSFTCGMLGLHVIFDVLSENGEGDLAYKMIAKSEFPSYKHLLDKGLTAWPEYFQENGNDRGSLNHHFFGDVSRWIVKAVAGLEVVNAKTVRIAPTLISTVDHAEAYYDMKDGRVSVAWKRETDGKIALTFAHPEGVTVDLSLPEDCAVTEEIV